MTRRKDNPNPRNALQIVELRARIELMPPGSYLPYKILVCRAERNGDPQWDAETIEDAAGIAADAIRKEAMQWCSDWPEG